jgi:hypothetical protein
MNLEEIRRKKEINKLSICQLNTKSPSDALPDSLPIADTIMRFLAINELSIALGEALANNQLTCITLGPNCPPIHSLLFADDLLICGQATPIKAAGIKHVLVDFCNASGQLPNWGKSGILFSAKVEKTPDKAFRLFFWFR